MAWFHAGMSPVPAVQLPTGTILVQDAGIAPAGGSSGVSALYVRVSSADQKAGLKRLLSDPGVSTIVVEHRERLARFGVEYIEAALTAQGQRLVAAEDTEVADDLVRDVTEVLTSLATIQTPRLTWRCSR